MKLSRFLDKYIFTQNGEIQNKNVDRKKKKKYCKTFKRGSNGFCKHYMRYKVDLVSCANEC